MSERPSCAASGVGDDDGRSRGRRTDDLPWWNRGGRCAVGTLTMLAVLAVGSAATSRALAQGAAPKSEAPKESAPVPAPPEIPKDSAPAARDEGTESPAVSPEALSVRYRFSEKYSTEEDPAKPELITQYQVGVVETLKEVWEKAQGAPEKRQSSQQTIYTERAAKVKDGEITDTVRRYDKVRVQQMPPVPTLNPPFLQNLEIWYHKRTGELPQISSLSGDRLLREGEYLEISHEPFVPQLTAFFKQVPHRVGDTWELPPPVAKLVWGERPDEEGYELTGTLIEVRKAATGTSRVAVIGVEGRFILNGAPNAFKARIHFTFETPEAVVPPGESGASLKATDGGTRTGARKRDEGIIDARGCISQVQMAQSVSRPIPDSDVRLTQTTTREVRLERRRLAVTADGSPPTLTIPETPPIAEGPNSWLTYDDPMGRFHFRHPQDLQVRAFDSDPNHVTLAETHPKGDSFLGINLQPRSSDAGRDRENRNPEYHRTRLKSSWESDKKDVVSGSADWLPDADWSPLKRKVYRIEAALKPKGEEANGAQRLYLDYYLVVFNSNESLVVTAMTTQDSNVKLRDQAEKVIKSLELGPTDGRNKTPALAPSRPQTRP